MFSRNDNAVVNIQISTRCDGVCQQTKHCREAEARKLSWVQNQPELYGETEKLTKNHDYLHS